MATATSDKTASLHLLGKAEVREILTEMRQGVKFFVSEAVLNGERPKGKTQNTLFQLAQLGLIKRDPSQPLLYQLSGAAFVQLGEQIAAMGKYGT